MPNNGDVSFTSKLDSVYEHARSLQVNSDATPYACQGSGLCCSHIGLRLHLSECENIANNIKREYWIRAERDGIAATRTWYMDLTRRLTERMFDASWEPTGKTDMSCAFLVDHRCSIYEYRPLVCRAYSVWMPEDNLCPRLKTPDGPYLLDGQMVVDRLEAVIKEWNQANPGYDYSIYYAAGILRYLLKDAEVEKLVGITDKKFWLGAPGYPHRMRPEQWDGDND